MTHKLPTILVLQFTFNVGSVTCQPLFIPICYLAVYQLLYVLVRKASCLVYIFRVNLLHFLVLELFGSFIFFSFNILVESYMIVSGFRI